MTDHAPFKMMYMRFYRGKKRMYGAYVDTVVNKESVFIKYQGAHHCYNMQNCTRTKFIYVV